MTPRRPNLPVILRDWLLLVPFLLSTLLAPGVMPHRTDDGSLTVVLCSETGPFEVRIDLATGKPLPVDSTPEDKRCDWQMARDGSALIEAPFAPVVRVVVVAKITPPLPLHLQLQTRHSRPEARGPPTLI
jgi:hypothetical protein